MKLYKKSIPKQEIRFDESSTLKNFVLGMLGAGMASSLLLMGGKAAIPNNFSSIIERDRQYCADELIVHSAEGYDLKTGEEKQNVSFYQVINKDEWKEIAQDRSRTIVGGNEGIVICKEQFEEYGNSISNVRKENNGSLIIINAPINSLLEFYGVNEIKETYSKRDLLELRKQLEAKKANEKETKVEEQNVSKKNLRDKLEDLYQMRELIIGKTVIEYPEINSQKSIR